jgi:hypothetical protein
LDHSADGHNRAERGIAGTATDLEGHQGPSRQNAVCGVCTVVGVSRLLRANWDESEECLADLEWLPAKGYILLITDAAHVLPEEEEYETSWRSCAM